MAGRFQLRRGNTAQNDAFIGAPGEITYDTQAKGIRVHDGVTPGGNALFGVVEFQHPTAGNNYTWYRKYSDGWVEQGGIFAVQGTGWKTAPTITLPVEMANDKYFVGFMGGYADYVDRDTVIITRTTTTLSLSRYVSNSSEACWEVKGMAA